MFNAVFDYFPVSKFKNITNVLDIEHITKYRVELNCMWKFYEVKKFKIQNDMEMRATHLQLMNITGEPHIYKFIPGQELGPGPGPGPRMAW